MDVVRRSGFQQKKVFKGEGGGQRLILLQAEATTPTAAEVPEPVKKFLQAQIDLLVRALKLPASWWMPTSSLQDLEGWMCDRNGDSELPWNRIGGLVNERGF